MSEHTTTANDPKPPTKPATASNPPAASRPSADPSSMSNPTPSAAAFQRALSSPNPDLQSKILRPAPLKQDNAADSSTPRWPISPRLKSPPPSNAAPRRGSASSRNSDLDPQGRRSGNSSSEEGTATTAHQASAKSSRATSTLNSKLETVEEGDMSSPREESMVQTAVPSNRSVTAPYQDNEAVPALNPNMPSIETVANASQRPAAGAKSDNSRQTSAPAALPKKPSTASLVPAKVRQTESSAQTMQVETETVNSIPQTSTNSGTERVVGRGESSGTIRAKPSTETIRPKKEKRKTSRKPPSIVSGPSTTKADIFEAKVASEIEGDDTDSDETFVYESEVPERRWRVRNHSRTPSTNSIASASERKTGIKSINSILDSHRVRAKRSMKFASSSYNPSSMDDEPEMSHSTPRRHEGSHQHFGLFGRGPNSASLEDAPFSQAAKLRINPAAASRNSSRIHSPRSANFHKNGDGFDYESGGGGENERTPLVGSVRGGRNRAGASRRGRPSNLRRIDYYENQRRPWLSRIAGCVVMFVMVILVLLGTAGFFFATTKPLSDVHIVEVTNVLASEQEVMLDLTLEAVNSNIATISISEVSLLLFARSQHGESSPWAVQRASMNQRTTRRNRPWRIESVDGDISLNGLFPPWDDDDDDKSSLTLGSVEHLDSPLSYVGTPFQSIACNSTGELRLHKPGKGLQEDGPAQWKQMLKHPFELIVRGIVKYTLPLNSKVISVSVRGGALVHPEDGVDVNGTMRVEQLKRFQRELHE